MAEEAVASGSEVAGHKRSRRRSHWRTHKLIRRLVPRLVLPAPKSQLQLLEAKLDEIAQDLQRKDMDGLLANRNFLEDRFGRRPATEQEPWPASERDERAS